MMKAGKLNGHATRIERMTGQKPNGERPLATPTAGRDRLKHLRHIVQQMGGPLNVVLGRMEYLLEGRADQETMRSLKAIMSQAEQLVELRQHLMDEVCVALNGADLAPPVRTRETGLPDP